MGGIDTGKKVFHGVFGLVPAGVAVVAVIKQSLAFVIIVAVLIFLYVALMPACRKRENLWMFLLVGVAGAPVNIWLSVKVIQMEMMFTDSALVVDILHGMFVFFILFSIEEIFFGVITRLIWKRQYKFLPD